MSLKAYRNPFLSLTQLYPNGINWNHSQGNYGATSPTSMTTILKKKKPTLLKPTQTQKTLTSQMQMSPLHLHHLHSQHRTQNTEAIAIKSKKRRKKKQPKKDLLTPTPRPIKLNKAFQMKILLRRKIILIPNRVRNLLDPARRPQCHPFPLRGQVKQSLYTGARYENIC